MMITMVSFVVMFWLLYFKGAHIINMHTSGIHIGVSITAFYFLYGTDLQTWNR